MLMRTRQMVVKTTLTNLSAIGLAASAALLAPLGAQAGTQNVILNPNLTWNGFENVFTNGVNSTMGPAYKSDYVGAGTSLPLQATMDSSGTVTIAPDIRLDQQFPMDTLIWKDASGSSTGICNVISTYYADSTAFAAGDTIIFSGSLATNGLAAPYTNTAVVFIK